MCFGEKEWIEAGIIGGQVGELGIKSVFDGDNGKETSVGLTSCSNRERLSAVIIVEGVTDCKVSEYCAEAFVYVTFSIIPDASETKIIKKSYVLKQI